MSYTHGIDTQNHRAQRSLLSNLQPWVNSHPFLLTSTNPGQPLSGLWCWQLKEMLKTQHDEEYRHWMEHDETWLFSIEIWRTGNLGGGPYVKGHLNFGVHGRNQPRGDKEMKRRDLQTEESSYTHAQRFRAQNVQGNAIEHRVQETWGWEIRLKMQREPFFKYWQLSRNYSLEQFPTFCLSLSCSPERSVIWGHSEGPEPRSVGVSNKWEQPK